MKKYIYCLVHEHKFGNSSYIFQSDKLYKDLSARLTKKLCQLLEIDFEPDFETLKLHYEKTVELPTI